MTSKVAELELLGHDYRGTVWEPLEEDRIVAGYSWVTFGCHCDYSPR